MNVIRSLWASIQGDPAFMRAVNGWLTLFWLGMIPVSLLTGWINSVTYVAALSLWALVSGHWSAWQAARVEVRQAADLELAEQRPLEERVVEALVAKTSLERAGGRRTAQRLRTTGMVESAHRPTPMRERSDVAAPPR